MQISIYLSTYLSFYVGLCFCFPVCLSKNHEFTLLLPTQPYYLPFHSCSTLLTVKVLFLIILHKFTQFIDPLLSTNLPWLPPILSAGHSTTVWSPPPSFPKIQNPALGLSLCGFPHYPLGSDTTCWVVFPQGCLPHHTWASTSCAILLLPCAVLFLLPYLTQL